MPTTPPAIMLEVRLETVKTLTRPIPTVGIPEARKLEASPAVRIRMSAMARHELVTLSELKDYIGITSGSDKDDALLLLLIRAASAFLLAEMNRREGLEHDYEHTKGYLDAPDDVRFACCELAALRYKEKSRLGEVSKDVGGQTVAFSQKDLSDFGRAVIRHYKRVTP
nr:MAG TPA: PORTAL PROTEIN, 15 PROTEIN, HEAD PROTEIN, VIRAL INFECTION, TAILED.2A [Caudoviricetes sp.]